ncbi:Uncharacterized protein XB17_02196 [Leptospira santarosai]|nr:Uncharacterized protein XB17_02196 [Leptospira santarosai]
MGKSQGISL